MGVSANREVCVGAGQCVLAAPEVFDQDDDGLVVVTAPDHPDDAAVRDAVHLCPAGAISHA
ncbi:ferredoxin [Kribbella catacumbae]|uniref:ferredoxin n=1 Tax=Kribbella catacumbae TaxID=460086 RepID=UPI00039E2762|nr:(4Fe-4S)-binding protein [Kribbella catacumbae]